MKINTFDEIQYRDDLVRAGLAPDDAATLAAKTARIRAEALKDAAFKAGLLKSGMKPEQANRQVEAARRFNSSWGTPPPA